MGRLDSLDLSLKLSRTEEAERLEAGHERIAALRLALGGKLGDGELGPPVCCVFEGWDASGKGGAIKRLVAPLDLRHVRVAQFAAPTHDEKRHHFLWRFWPALPGWGGMAVFDRSWYGRVLVERVEGFASMDQWERAYDEIVSFERTLALEGMILIKFWVHISEAEQLKRFERRAKDPLKNWKLTDEDWRNREQRPAYEKAVEDMLARTDHELGHWQLVEGDSKRWARVKVLETVIAEIEAGMRERGFEPPAFGAEKVAGSKLTAAAVVVAVAVALAVLPASGAPSRPPVVLVIFDELPGDALLARNGRIDAKRYPAFAQLARDGWWFRNAHTVFDFTRQAVPMIFDGRRPSPGGGGSQKAHPQTIYDVLGYRGYRMVPSEDVTALCPQRWCPGAPSSSPDTLKALAGGRPRRIRRWIGRIRRGVKPAFYVKHTLLPHVPYLYLPSGRRTRNGVRDPVPGMNGEQGFGDSFLTRHNEQRFLLQLGFVDRQLGALIRRLRRAGLYDRALIVVTADHGGSFETGVSSRRKVTLGNVDEVGTVPLIVKRPGQRRGRTSRALVRTLDVMPTIADVVNAPIPFSTDGRSAFGRETQRRRFLRIPTRDFDRTIQISGRAWEKRRRAVVRRRLRRYGSGDLASLYTGIGPHRGLIGEDLAQLKPAPIGRARAEFVSGGRLRRVRPGSGLMPVQLAGTIRGGRPGARRNLAVAVNGKVRAVGRTWRLRGQRQERFALNLPEAALLRGRNRVVLMEVRRGGKSLRIIGRI